MLNFRGVSAFSLQDMSLCILDLSPNSHLWEWSEAPNKITGVERPMDANWKMDAMAVRHVVQWWLLRSVPPQRSFLFQGLWWNKPVGFMTYEFQNKEIHQDSWGKNYPRGVPKDFPWKKGVPETNQNNPSALFWFTSLKSSSSNHLILESFKIICARV